VVKQLAFLVTGLATVLVLAGQLARAAVPKAAVPNDSNPYWSWDARTVAFQQETSGVNEVGVVSAGHGGHRLHQPGGAARLAAQRHGAAHRDRGRDHRRSE